MFINRRIRRELQKIFHPPDVIIVPMRAQRCLNRDFLRRESLLNRLDPFRMALGSVDKDTLLARADDVRVGALEVELWLVLARL